MIVPDLRFDARALPEPAPGYDPAGDARAMVSASYVSPAPVPIPGRRVRGSFGPGHRFVASIPEDWNGRLVVCGTPAMRSEHASDLIFGEWLLGRGYAYAASNKGVPYNAIVEPWTAASDPATTYRVPFAMGEAPPGTLGFRLGALDPHVVPVASWQADLPALVRAAREIVREVGGRGPVRTYVAGLSIGGGQVRSLLEREPELADGGLEWAAVYWHPDRSILSTLPPFLRAMAAYVASGYADADAAGAIVAAGYPPDRVGPSRVAGLRSLWDANYAALPPFYADLTTFAFARNLDPDAGPLDTLARRAAYVPSAAARANVAAFAHTGRLERPLIGIAGDADAFITPHHNFEAYAQAVRDANRGHRYWPYLIAGGTHVDAYADFGWHLQPQLPFAWRAFERLVALVEDGDGPRGDGIVRTISSPDEIR